MKGESCMSHWFTVETRFQSGTAIKKAANSLGFQVRHNTKCRGYNGQTKECDLVMKLPGNYDVGFQKQADGSYAVVADFWQDHISKYLANPAVLAKANEMYPAIAKEQGHQEAEAFLANAKMSRFTQQYNYYLVQELAQSQGLSYTQSIADDGSIIVELTGEPFLMGVN